MICAACRSETADNSRFCPICGTPLTVATRSREARKTVTILFMDIVGSTSLAERLDPEPLHQIMERYFAACSSAIIEHGGAVEKFIGDAVMAVFGATVSREDDAPRAVSAAAAMVAAIRELSDELTVTHRVRLEVRCGICSGEVVSVTAGNGDFRVIGDPVNTAARLQTAADPGQILVGEDTARLVRACADLRPVAPLLLKGKAEPVPAWQFISLKPAGRDDPAPRVPSLIGRADELAELLRFYRRATASRTARQISVLGPPGIGKSRLVRQLVTDYLARDAIVLTGRCSAYGRGITYKPLADLLGSYPGGWSELILLLATAGAAGDRAARVLAGIMHGTQAAPGTPTGVEEISWAVRFLLELMGAAGPVVVIWEDLHQAEATLLDLIEDVNTWLHGVPVLVICVARTDLLELRPGWCRGVPGTSLLELGPLTYEQSAEMVCALAMGEDVLAHDSSALCERVARECDGNPLIAELMIDVFAETAPGSAVPPTIHALFSARLDQLPPDERRLLELAAVAGREFTWSQLDPLIDAEQITQDDAAELMASLVRRRIIEHASNGALRFGQSLLRDTAYALAPKTCRERWHLLLATWYAGGEAAADDRLALAYHVEVACLLRSELRPGDSALPGLAAQAAAILLAEGRTAQHRQDLPGAAALLERGRGLLPDDDDRQTSLALHISDCWLGLSDSGRALTALTAPGGVPDRQHQLVCSIQRQIVELRLGLAPAHVVADRAEQLSADLAADPGADRAWCRYWQLTAYLHLAADRTALADEALSHALEHARHMDDADEAERLLCAICELAQWAPSPVSAGLDLCARLSVEFTANRALLVPVLLTQARLAALAGDHDSASAALAAVMAHAHDLHIDRADAVTMAVAGFVASVAGDHEQAAAHYRRGCELLTEMGQLGDAQAVRAAWARELFELGQLDRAADALAALGSDLAAMEPRARIAVLGLRARAESTANEHGTAVALATEAARLADDTDDLCLQGDALFDLAAVSHQAGCGSDAVIAAQQASARYQLRGATQLDLRLRDWLIASGLARPDDARG
jgi:class 3 adenylate cyclase